MSVTYGVSIFVPYVCGVYTCECGRRAIRHGPGCGSPPRGWESRPAGQDVQHVCDVCCRKSSRPAT